MWYIDRNYEEFSVVNEDRDQTPEDCVYKPVNVRSRGFEEERRVECNHPFRIYDTDGILYYTGMSSIKESFGPLEDYACPNAGATDIQYLNVDGEWETL